MKKGLVIVLSALVLASCGRPQRTVTPKSSDSKQTSTSEKKQSGMDLKAIKAKDYSSIKGIGSMVVAMNWSLMIRAWSARMLSLMHRALSRRTRSLR